MNMNMKKISDRGRKILSRIFCLISVAAASLVLQACYGTPEPMDDEASIRGKVLAKETQVPIVGIKVSINGTKYYEYTNKDGYFYLLGVPIQNNYTIKFEDVDGPYNGGLFKEQTWTLKQDEIYNSLLIQMDTDTQTDEE